ncbi:MAG: hypothetical protein AAFV43_07440 [Planctomycetota bacterium]
MRYSTGTLVVVCLLAAEVAFAGVTQLTTRAVARNPPDDPQLDLTDTYTIDFFVDFEGSLGGQQLLITLDQGSVINHPVGSDTPPSSELFEAFPALEYDSFVALGGFTAETSGDFILVGGAVNLGGSALGELGPDLVNVAWGPSVGVVFSDQTDYPLARMTFSSDARGFVQYLGVTTDGQSILLSGTLNGTLIPDGDFKADGRVDNADLNLMLTGWGASTAPVGWVHNFGGSVDNEELNWLLNSWGEEHLSGVFQLTAPEPSMLIGSVLLLTLQAVARRRG